MQTANENGDVCPASDDQGKKKWSPTQKHLDKREELKHWKRNREQLNPAAMHDGERLLNARRNARKYDLIPPYLEAEKFVSYYTKPFIVLLLLATMQRKHKHLHISNLELAQLLGCSTRTVYNATREAQYRGYCGRIEPLFDEPLPGFVGRDPEGRKLKHVQIPNAYEPGPLLRRVWDHWVALRGEWDRDQNGPGNRFDADPLPQQHETPKPPFSEMPGADYELQGGHTSNTTATPSPAPPPPATTQAPLTRAPGRTAPDPEGLATPPPTDGTPTVRLLMEGNCKVGATDGTTSPDAAPAAKPAAPTTPARSRPLVHVPRDRLPTWYTADLLATRHEPDAAHQAAALRAVVERGELWLTLTESGASEPEIAAAVARLKLAQEQAERERAGSVCYRKTKGSSS